jgi:hypothetical protein
MPLPFSLAEVEGFPPVADDDPVHGLWAPVSILGKGGFGVALLWARVEDDFIKDVSFIPQL